MVRISYLDAEDLPAEHKNLTESAVSLDSEAPAYEYLLEETTRNAYRAQAHLPEGLAAYQNLYSQVAEASGLTDFEQNLIALGVSQTIDSEYEWHNMVRIALNTGMSEDTIRNIAEHDPSAFDEPYSTLLRYVSQFVDGAIDDDLHDRMESHYDEQTIAAISMLAGYWVANGLVIHALDIDTEEPFFGWRLENIEKKQ